MTVQPDRIDEIWTDLIDRDIEALIAGDRPANDDLSPLDGFITALNSFGSITPPSEFIESHAALAAASVRESLPPAPPPTPARRTRRIVLGAKRRLVAVMASVAMISGMTGVAWASDSAVPGDWNYGIDLALEAIGIGAGGAEERLAELGVLESQAALATDQPDKRDNDSNDTGNAGGNTGSDTGNAGIVGNPGNTTTAGNTTTTTTAAGNTTTTTTAAGNTTTTTAGNTTTTTTGNTTTTTTGSGPDGVASLSGTLVSSAREGEILAGGKTLVITLTDDIWGPSVGADNAITTAVINGIDSAQAETTGWDAVVKAGLTFNEVVRSSDTVVTITLPGFASYDITAPETITVTVPIAAVAGGEDIVATPAFGISALVSTSFTSKADTHGDQSSADNNFGTSVEMFVHSKAPAINQRSFLRFDVSSIPAGSTIDSATLKLCVIDVHGSTRTYNLHRVTAGWGEGTLTWNNQPAVAATATDSATTVGKGACMTWTVTADVQAWVDGTANNGWRVRDAVEEGVDELTKFNTREHNDSGQRPKLVVSYAP